MKPLFAFFITTMMCWATPPWSHFDLNNFAESYTRYRTSTARQAYTSPIPLSYPEAFDNGSHFVKDWQLLDSDSADYGGIIEAETGELRDVIQTDNTQESVIIWSIYKELFASDTFNSSTTLSLNYISHFPAYDEEISEYSFYYPVWNCGLALLMVIYYTNAYDDSSLISYGDTCATFVIDSILPLATAEPLYNWLHCLVTAFVSGALAQYGHFRDNDYYIERAESLATRAKLWAEAHPDTAFGMEIWAMSPGTIIWGLLHSYFAVHSDELEDWVSDYIEPFVPEMAPPATSFDVYIWDNSWNIWYANGYRALAQFLPDTLWWHRFRTIVDYLLQQDTDDDGGIPASAAHSDTMDMTWVTTYMLFMGLEGIWDSLYEYDVGAIRLNIAGEPQHYYIVGDTIPIYTKVANCGTSNLHDAVITLLCDDDTLFERSCSLPLGTAIEETILWLPESAGEHHLALTTRNDDDDFQENDTLTMNIYITPIVSIEGYMADSMGMFVDGELRFYSMYDSTTPIASVRTDSTTHLFVATIPEILCRVRIEPRFPFPSYWLDSVDISALTTDWTITLPYPQIMLVSDDSGDYRDYFAEPMESLGVYFSVWNREDGEITDTITDIFRWKTILWFTGDETESTITPVDMLLLSNFINGGGKVILSGQYIAEDIFGSTFWDDYIGAVITGSGESIYLHDIFGEHRLMATRGDGSAWNQTSLDWMLPTTDSEVWIVKSASAPDTEVVAFSRTFATDGAILFSSLGFEGIGRISGSTMLESRKEFFEKLIDWLNPTEIEEKHKTQSPQKNSVTIFPNPFNSSCIITVPIGTKVEICDLMGKVVHSISSYQSLSRTAERDDNTYCEGPWTFIWTPNKSTPSGMYLINAKTEDGQWITRRILYLK